MQYAPGRLLSPIAGGGSSPSLDFDFTALSALPSTVTFARASSATMWSSGVLTTVASNVARFDSDPVSTVTNQVLQSQNLTSGSWTKSSCTATGDVTTDPLGTTTADLLTGTLATVHASQTITIVSGARVVFSIYAKQGGGGPNTFMRLRVQSGAEVSSQWFNLATGGVGSTASTANIVISSPTATDAGNGWWRVSAVYQTTGFTSLIVGAGPALANSNGGTPGDTVYLWGAQGEQTSGAVGVYVATTTTAASYYPPRGLLIEEPRTNQMPGTMTGGTYWQGAATSLATGATAPDGTTNGVTLTQSAGGAITYGASPLVGVFATITASTPTTASIFAKAGTCTFLRMFLTDSNTPTISSVVWFNLATGVIGTQTNSGGPTSTSSTMTALPNGWYRCTITATLGSATTATILIRMASADAVTTDAGSKTFSVFGPQLEAGAWASSYIPTTTASAARVLDSATMTPLGSWYNESEGTFLVDYQSPNQTSLVSTGVVFGVTDGTANNVIYLTAGAAFDGGNINLGGVGQMGVSNTSPPLTAKKTALVYRLNDSAWVRNGGTVATDTSCTIPTGMVSASLGKAPWSTGNVLNGYLRRLRVYRARKSNTEIQALTT
jgi:hypothetical protein